MWKDCNGNGRCGRSQECVCFDGWFGSKCEVSIELIEGFFAMEYAKVVAHTSQGKIRVPVYLLTKDLVPNITTTLNVNSVGWASSNGTAISGIDFQLTVNRQYLPISGIDFPATASGITIMPKGVVQANIDIPLIYPYMYPRPINMTVELSPLPSFALSDYLGPSVAPANLSSTIVTVIEDRPPVVASCSQSSAYRGLTLITVHFVRGSTWLQHAARVHFSTSNGTAEHTADYEAVEGVLTVAAGATSVGQVQVKTVPGGRTMGATLEVKVTRVEVECVPGDGKFECHGAAGVNCSLAVVDSCGDELKTGTEGCDDGNRLPGDGCDANCVLESGFDCVGGSATSKDVCSVPTSSPAGTEFVRARTRITGLSVETFVGAERLAFRRAVGSVLSMNYTRVEIERVTSVGGAASFRRDDFDDSNGQDDGQDAGFGKGGGKIGPEGGKGRERGRGGGKGGGTQSVSGGGDTVARAGTSGGTAPASCFVSFRATVGNGYGQTYAEALRVRAKKGHLASAFTAASPSQATILLVEDPVVVKETGETVAIFTPPPDTPAPTPVITPSPAFELSAPATLSGIIIFGILTAVTCPIPLPLHLPLPHSHTHARTHTHTHTSVFSPSSLYAN